MLQIIFNIISGIGLVILFFWIVTRSFNIFIGLYADAEREVLRRIREQAENDFHTKQ